MAIAVISANMGGFDNPKKHIKQSIDYDFFLFNDKNFPPRTQSMTPRLQARIPKMFGWQMKPNYDYYIWVDSSCRLAHKDSIKWFLEQLDEQDIAVFKHPNRDTLQQEADYLKQRLAKKCPYITPRYKNERIDDQLSVVDPGLPLFASTAFIYRNVLPVRDALTMWWLHTSLYHSIDQLSLPHVIKDLSYNVIHENYMKCKYLEYTR